MGIPTYFIQNWAIHKNLYNLSEIFYLVCNLIKLYRIIYAIYLKRSLQYPSIGIIFMFSSIGTLQPGGLS